MWNRVTAILLLSLVVTACSSKSVPASGSPVAGAESNTTEPQWVVRQSPRADVAVVFIHGIFGDTLGTWTNASGASFFKLLNQDPSAGGKLDMFAFGYTSKLIGHGSFTIQEAANSLHERLKFHGVLDYPAIVFVAHSMGGLVVFRELLTHREILDRVPLIALYGTPQEGSQIAVIATRLSANPALADMLPADANSYLQGVNDEWKAASHDRPIPVVCGYEKLPTGGITIVPWTSATRFCTGPADPIEANHIGLVKPDRPNHESIVLLVNALNRYVLGKELTAKLELPDFTPDQTGWAYAMSDPYGKQRARLVNAGRLPLRYTIAQLSDPELYIWPEDTPRMVAGNSSESLSFALGLHATQKQYHFVIQTNAGPDQSVTVHVPDSAAFRAKVTMLTVSVTKDLNAWLASAREKQALAAMPADDPQVAALVVEHVRQSIANADTKLPESLQWVMTAEVLNASNLPTFAVTALRNAEQMSPTVVKNISVARLAALTAAASGESRVFRSVPNATAIPPWDYNISWSKASKLDLKAASELANHFQSVPALKAAGFSLRGDVEQKRGDAEAARVAYERALHMRPTPSLVRRIMEANEASKSAQLERDGGT